jgi:hypothetical protein
MTKIGSRIARALILVGAGILAILGAAVVGLGLVSALVIALTGSFPDYDLTDLATRALAAAVVAVCLHLAGTFIETFIEIATNNAPYSSPPPVPPEDRA